ncbi:unnamed protein product [Polarella glacialis]|uniref:Large ribosomal subunit protein uL24c n=1 Tax=Polarella glacialis TaxID=89957 RepID=A0A813GEN5_POLGL|nr:unnamed protein product [Polarella glacialis]
MMAVVAGLRPATSSMARTRRSFGLALAALAAATTWSPVAFISGVSHRAPPPQQLLGTVAGAQAILPSAAPSAASGASLGSAVAAAAALMLLAAPRRSAAAVGRSAPQSKVVMFARTPFPTTPIGSRGKRRQRAGRMRPIFRGRQIAVRVNMKTNKPIKYHMHVRPGDVVQVMKGKDAGKVTEVIRVFPKWNKILCLGVNYCIKHVRPTREDEVGSRVQVEAPMHASSVMHYCEKQLVAGNLGIKFEKKIITGGKEQVKKVRFNKASGEDIPTRIPNKWVPVLDRN